MTDLRHATGSGHNMKYCPQCTHTLPLDQFDPLELAPDGLVPFCRACVAKRPWLLRATCRRCGSSRKLAKFPNADQTQPCVVCAPHAATESGEPKSPVLLALESADLVEGTPKTAAELLEDIGFYDASRPDVIAAGKWLSAEGFERGRRSAQKVYHVGVRELETGTLSDLLDDLDDLPSGRMTVTEFLAATGVSDDPSKADLNEGARWLRHEGFNMVRVNGRRAFDLGDDLGTDETFTAWAKAYPHAVEHLRLDSNERRQLERGGRPDHRTRLAMSALIAGLPPYAAPETKP